MAANTKMKKSNRAIEAGFYLVESLLLMAISGVALYFFLDTFEWHDGLMTAACAVGSYTFFKRYQSLCTDKS